MAGGIKGITVEIGGNTAPLNKALESVNKTTRDLQSELKAVDKALKLDPNNITLVKQKQTILKEEIAATKEKLDALKEAQEKVNKAHAANKDWIEQYTPLKKQIDETTEKMNKLTKQEADMKDKFASGKIDIEQYEKFNKELEATAKKHKELLNAKKELEKQFKDGHLDDSEYRNFQRELETTKAKLKSLKEEKQSVSVIAAAFGTVKDKIAEATSKLQPFINGLKTAGKVSAEITDAGIKTVGKTVDVAEKGLKIYAGTAAAAGTALAGLTVKAAGAADDINTLAAQTGLSTEQIQKFQYASELIDVPMETLTGSMAKLTRNMASAQKGTGAAADAFKQLGVSIKDDATGELRSNQAVFNDAIIALGKIDNATQRDALAMQIFGRSAQELNPLILGGADTLKKLGDEAEAAGLILSQQALDNLNGFRDSLDIMQASAGQAGNVLAGTFAGGLKGSIDILNGMIPKVTGSIAQLFSGENMAAAQQKLTADLISGANQIISQFAAQLPTFLNGFNAVIISIVTAIITVLPTAINTILPTLITGFTNLIQGLLPQVPILLPIIINAAVTLFMGLLDGLNTIIPQLMAMLPGIIQNVSNILIQNLPLIIEAGIQLLTSLITGITNCIPQLIDAVVALIPVITKAIVDNLPALIKAGIQLIVALAKGLPKGIPAIIQALPEIIAAIINGLLSVNWLDVGWQIIKGIVKGLWDGIRNIDFKAIGNSLLNGLKNVLGIHSPSTLFRDIVGKNLALGIGEGFNEQMKSVSEDMAKTIPKSFSTNVNANIKTNSSTTEGYNTNSQSNIINNIYLDGEQVRGILDKKQGRALAYAGRSVGI